MTSTGRVFLFILAQETQGQFYGLKPYKNPQGKEKIPCGIKCQLSPSAMLSTLDAQWYLSPGSFKMTKGLVASIRDYDFIGSG